MKRNHILATLAASTAALMVADTGLAQSVHQPSAEAVPTSPADIVVTANKREERLKDVPITVSVIGADQLVKQNVNAVADLIHSAPGLNSAGPFGALSIRGVGSVSFARSAEGSVGVVVDGVALANTSNNPPQLFDVARVEVLEGPQGTLFGRNSSAGVVNITTVAPDPSKWEAIGHADIATRDNYIGRAALNIPVSGNAALRVSGSFSQAPRNQYNRYDDSWLRIRGASGRARFLWKPIADLTFNVIGDYTKFSNKGGAPWTVYQSTPGSALSNRLAACGVTVERENHQACIDGGNHTSTESYGVSAQVDADLGGPVVTSITAYRGYEAHAYASDVDSSPVNRLNVNASPMRINNYSEELRLTSPGGGRVDYVLGLYYFDSELNGTNTQAGNILADLPAAACPFTALGLPAALCRLPVGQVQTTHATTTSYAAFGNLTVHLFPKLRILLGARYGREEVQASTRGVLIPGALTGIASIAPIDGAINDTYFSYKLGVQYDLTHDIMAYGTYTRGYKGPSVNDQTGTGNIPKIVRPEIPHAGEIGLKANLFSNRLTASIAGFYNRIDDFQAQFFDPSVGAYVFGNAPKLTTKGVSVNILGRPVRGLSVNLGGVYNDAKYGSGYLVSCAQGQTAAQGCLTLPSGARVDDAGGNQLIGAPKWKLTAYAEYSRSLGSRLEGFAAADMVYNSRVNFDAAYSPQNHIASAAIFGARLGVRMDGQRYGISIFARNLFDVYRPIVTSPTPTARQQLDPLSFVQIAGPDSRRVIGLSLDAKF